MHWRRHIYMFEVLKLHRSEVMMSTSFEVKVVSVKVAHVGTSFEVPCLGYHKIEALIDHKIIKYHFSHIHRFHMARGFTSNETFELIRDV